MASNWPDPQIHRVFIPLSVFEYRIDKLLMGICTQYAIFFMVAVGMTVARHPPHRSQRALLTHWAPASGSNVQTQVRIRMTDPWQRYPTSHKAVHPVPVDLTPLTSAA
jgi:hypothetical protein